MTVYDIFDSENPDNKVGSFEGKIEGDTFSGMWTGVPLTKMDSGPWIIKKGNAVLMEDCYLECVDEFNVEEQTIYGKGVPL